MNEVILFCDRPVAEYNTSPVGMDIRDRNRNSFWARFSRLRPLSLFRSLARHLAMGPTNGRACERPPLLHRPFIRDEVRVGREGEREGGRGSGQNFHIQLCIIMPPGERLGRARERGTHARGRAAAQARARGEEERETKVN